MTWFCTKYHTILQDLGEYFNHREHEHQLVEVQPIRLTLSGQPVVAVDVRELGGYFKVEKKFTKTLLCGVTPLKIYIDMNSYMEISMFYRYIRSEPAPIKHLLLYCSRCGLRKIPFETVIREKITEYIVAYQRSHSYFYKGLSPEEIKEKIMHILEKGRVGIIVSLIEERSWIPACEVQEKQATRKTMCRFCGKEIKKGERYFVVKQIEFREYDRRNWRGRIVRHKQPYFVKRTACEICICKRRG